MPSSLPPSIRPNAQRTLESYVDRLGAILRDAEADGLGTLAYLISIAEVEAKNVVQNGRREAEARKARPEDLWRP